MAHHNRAMRSAAPGFTLVELMVAVAVFVLLGTLALPSFATHLEKSRVRGAADALVDQLLHARMAAVKAQRSVAWSMTGAGTSWCAGANEAEMPTAGLPVLIAMPCDCAAASVACRVDGRASVVGSAQHRGVQVVSPALALAFDGRQGTRADAAGLDTDARAASIALASASGRIVLAIRIAPLGHASVCSKAGALLGVPAC